ncbi:sulfotransferase [Marinobacter sp. LV10MA510-1]|uniref:sulfotransferase n=1 Tax=Marinobacter sp. LV10MA510-1 TaxID=1415567 RepID=UPI000BF56D94|nr:sulfotransferase [Marinobacter sp. LV10MA510-1]PFG09274.1 hypothetical protein ATI45_1642 [Marinobacter sp. LV10MA510-1]
MFNAIRVVRRQKVFVIGFNKTGTTTMSKALRNLGYVVGREDEAKSLFDAWLRRDFKKIVKFCRSAQAFQDSPFSFPYTFIALDQAFPNSKFILTIRDNEDQWYQSITRFHSKLWASGDGIPPTKEQLKEAVNSYKGRPWDVNRALFNTPENDPYSEKALKSIYLQHNQAVVSYFKSRPNDLLVINVAEQGAYQKFVEFLGVDSAYDEFPWENKT